MRTPAAGSGAASVSPGPSAASRSAVVGAVFLMATSAIGPGFLTQTATFTSTLGAAFARSSVLGILVTGVMRILLFLAILGVVAGGATLSAEDPAGSAFREAAGEAGLRVFGVVLWAAALTSVIGAAYTSVSFITSSRTSERRRNLLTVAFIAVTAGVFVVIEQTPARLLVFAGTFNGLILPIGFAVLLYVAWRRRDLLDGYRYPRWLLGSGVLAWLLTLYLGWNAIKGLGQL